MSMKEIALESTPVELFTTLGIAPTAAVIQNRTGGPIYLWLDNTPPVDLDSGFLIKSGEFYSINSGSNAVYVSGTGKLVVEY